MNDLDRIKEIERILGFPLHRVEKLEQLTTENVFYTASLEYTPFFIVRTSSFYRKGTRNYCIDKTGKVIGLSLNFVPLTLLPKDFLISFSHLTHLSLKNNQLEDYSFLKRLKGLTFLSITFNQLIDISFLKELKEINSLDENVFFSVRV